MYLYYKLATAQYLGTTPSVQKYYPPPGKSVPTKTVPSAYVPAPLTVPETALAAASDLPFTVKPAFSVT